MNVNTRFLMTMYKKIKLNLILGFHYFIRLKKLWMMTMWIY